MRKCSAPARVHSTGSSHHLAEFFSVLVFCSMQCCIKRFLTVQTITLSVNGQTERYLRDQKRSVGVSLCLPQSESPGRTAAQGHADVIPGAHAARNSSAKSPWRNHRMCQPEQQQQQQLPPPLHLRMIPIIELIPESSPQRRRRRHGTWTRPRVSHATDACHEHEPSDCFYTTCRSNSDESPPLTWTTQTFNAQREMIFTCFK